MKIEIGNLAGFLTGKDEKIICICVHIILFLTQTKT